MRRWLVLLACVAGLAIGASVWAASSDRAQLPSPIADRAPVVAVAPLAAYPHDPGAYTQGLVWQGGRLFESTGGYGASSLREVRVDTGEVLRGRAFSPVWFAEGLAPAGRVLVQITWRERTAFVWDRETFRLVRRFRYRGEGWGLATLNGRLVMSDGTATLRFRDPGTFREERRVRVTDGGRAVSRLNELEVVRGEIWANVYRTDRIVVIDPATGRVRVRLDLSGLRELLPAGYQPEVLNGIAWDRARDRVLVTGKYWPALFEIPSRVPATP